MISLKTRSVRVARWLASATEAMDRAGKTLVLGLLACLAATLMAATPTLAQQITSTSWSPNPVVGPGQTITFTVFFNSGTRVITSLTVDSQIGVTYNCTGGIGNGQTGQTARCVGTYVTTAGDVLAGQVQERPDVRLMAFSTPITVTGRVMTVPVQAVVTPDVSIAVSPDNVAEDGATNLTYTVTRSAASTSSLTVNLNTSGTATSGTDYTGAVATVVIPANATTATVTLNPTADATIESDETATLTVVSGSGYNVGTSSSATGTILNDDLPSLAINDVTLSEGNSGTTSATFTVSLSAPAGPGGVTFDIATANGTATAGSDYTANSLTSQTITSGSST